MAGFQKKLWIGLLVMAFLTPLGIFLPEKFKADGPWGEWGIEKLEKFFGYVPEGLRKLTDFWKAPIPDYNPVIGSTSMPLRAISYIASGLLGVGICAFLVYVVSKFMAKHGK
ncbi:MAG TPA: cobalamin biosynthesis protein [Thermodesulfobacteriota bacterium]|nr:cobalamin biosynthesis protein [Thermodesulfobacteriota bacterium]